MERAVGISIQRKEAWDKVTGRAKYTDDFPVTDVLSARLLTSTYAHAKIKRIDTSKAMAMRGVKAVLTGGDFKELSDRFFLTVPRSPECSALRRRACGYGRGSGRLLRGRGGKAN